MSLGISHAEHPKNRLVWLITPRLLSLPTQPPPGRGSEAKRKAEGTADPPPPSPFRWPIARPSHTHPRRPAEGGRRADSWREAAAGMSSGSPGPRGLPARLQKLRLPRSRGPRPGQRPALPSEEGGPREEGSHVTAGPALRRPGAGMGRAFKARPGRPSREPSCRRRSRSRAETAARSLVAAFASKAGRGRSLGDPRLPLVRSQPRGAEAAGVALAGWGESGGAA